LNNQTTLYIGGWQIDASTNRIGRDGVEKKLEPRSMELLMYLADHPDQVVSRQEIEENVWKGRVVGYDALSGSIVKIRKAFGDTSKKPRIIETIPKAGYRLIAPVIQEEVEQTSITDQPIKISKAIIWALSSTILVAVITAILVWQPWAPIFEPASETKMQLPLPDKPSLVVLPFTNISDDKEQDYFADGITDDLLIGLSKLPDLFLISRSTAYTYKNKSVKIRQVAEELGVRYVIEGSVRRAGNTVRINVQLIDALSGGHVWAEKYDGDMNDIFRLQDDVVARIVYSLDQNIVPHKTVAATDVPEAYDLYLQGMKHYYLLDPANMAKAIEFFRQATMLDSNYYEAYAQLALAYGWIIDSGWRSELDMTWDQVKRFMKWSLEAALRKPTSTAYLASAWMEKINEKYEEALEEIDKAITLNPNDPYNFTMKAAIMNQIGLPKEAELNALRAIRLNPKNASIHIGLLGVSLFHQDRFIEAAEAFEKAAMLEPYYEWNYLSLAATYGHLGELLKAKTALEKFEEIRADRKHTPLTVQQVSKWGELKDMSFRERFLEGLRIAGVPER
jgi:TolB-like protein/DNA-binding winged helix-turn-helix (wHTH) protein